MTEGEKNGFLVHFAHSVILCDVNKMQKESMMQQNGNGYTYEIACCKLIHVIIRQ